MKARLDFFHGGMNKDGTLESQGNSFDFISDVTNKSYCCRWEVEPSTGSQGKHSKDPRTEDCGMEWFMHMVEAAP